MKKRQDSGNAIPVLTTLLVIVLLLTILATYYVFITGKDNERILLEINEQRALSEQIAKYVLSAANGNVDAFAQIASSRERFDRSIASLKSLSPESMRQPVTAHETLWLEMRGTADKVAANREQISELTRLINLAIARIPGLQSNIRTITRQIVSVTAGERPDMRVITQQLQVLERMGRSLDNIFRGG